MLFKKKIEEILKNAWGDPMTEVINQEKLDLKNGLLATHSMLINTYRSRDESGERCDRNFCLHLKSLPKDRKFKERISGGEGLFFKESYYFETLVPELIYKYQGIRWYPVHYGSFLKNELYTRLIHDLSECGYVKRTVFDSVVEINHVLKSLAHMHCASIVADARIVRQPTANRTQTLDDIHGQEIMETMFNQETSIIARFYQMGIKLTCALAGQQFQEDVKPLAEVLNKTAAVCIKSTTHCNVMCHGDLRKENMLFTDRAPFAPCVFMNYYVCRYAPLALDLLQVFYIHMSTPVRNAQWHEMLKFYSAALVVAMDDFTETPADVKLPTYKENLAACEELKLFGPTIALVYLTLSLLDAMEIETFMKDWLENVNKVDAYVTPELIQGCAHILSQNDLSKVIFKQLYDECMDFTDKPIAV